jgi:hypothetical protein
LLARTDLENVESAHGPAQRLRHTFFIAPEPRCERNNLFLDGVARYDRLERLTKYL